MSHIPMGFGDLTIHGPSDTWALYSSFKEVDFEKIKQISPLKILKQGPPTAFQIIVANGQLETPIEPTELQFEVGDITFVERFIVIPKIAIPLIGLFFLQINDTVLDVRREILTFPSFSMQLKDANNL